MPTYVYKCKKCKREFEIEQRITEDALTDCPFDGCDGEIFRKISGNVGLMFKGSGFYLTDYANRHESASTSKAPKNGNSEPAQASVIEAGPGANGKTEVKITN